MFAYKTLPFEIIVNAEINDKQIIFYLTKENKLLIFQMIIST